jgi:hypothetical protein
MSEDGIVPVKMMGIKLSDCNKGRILKLLPVGIKKKYPCSGE